MFVSQPLFVQAFNFVIFMAFVMLTIEQNIQNFSPVTIFCLVAFTTQTVTNFVTYSTAQAFTESSIEFAHIIQRSLWYRLPVHQQKKLIFTIERAEKSFLLKGAYIFQVNMEVFANVSDSFSWNRVNFRLQDGINSKIKSNPFLKTDKSSVVDSKI